METIISIITFIIGVILTGFIVVIINEWRKFISESKPERPAASVIIEDESGFQSIFDEKGHVPVEVTVRSMNTVKLYKEDTRQAVLTPFGLRCVSIHVPADRHYSEGYDKYGYELKKDGIVDGPMYVKGWRPGCDISEMVFEGTPAENVYAKLKAEEEERKLKEKQKKLDRELDDEFTACIRRQLEEESA